MCSRILSEYLTSNESYNNAQKLKSCLHVLNSLKEIYNVQKSTDTRHLDDEKFQQILLATRLVISAGDCQCTPEVSKSELRVEMFRCLRNSCVQCEDNQNKIREFPELYGTLVVCLSGLVEKLAPGKVTITDSLEADLLSLRCGLQFLGNFVVGNERNQALVWEFLYSHQCSTLLCILKFTDEKVADYTAMILFNVLNRDNCSLLLRDTCRVVEISHHLVASFVNANSHWSVLVLEKLCQEPLFWETYIRLTLSDRLVVLDIIAEQLSGESPKIAEGFLKKMSNWFEENVLDVVKCATEVNDEKPQEIMRVLSVLSSCSAKPTYQLMEQNIKLLEATVNVLKAVHILGKTDTNVFSAVSSLRVRSDSNDLPEDSPAYGFKKDLVKLIGNFCSLNRKCQDLVRELDGIPLLLDCCNMDAKNPYIIQWCTFALRNVMENNPDNQSVLANLTVTGELVNSPLLSELGLCVVQDDSGKISVQKS